MQLVGLIPARGGSKRVPRKNIRDFCGAPLIGHTCVAARASNVLADVFVSTDCDEIAEVCGRYDVEAPYRRAPGLADDASPMAPVVAEFVQWCRSRPIGVDAVVLLQPTSPLRTAAHIDAACRLFADSGADTVVSVTPTPHNFHPQRVMSWRGGKFGAYLSTAPRPGHTGKVEQVYGRNGPAILITKPAVADSNTLYGAHIEPFVMAGEVSVDINSEEDFRLAALLFETMSDGKLA